jgi:hypothetical protein
MIVNQEELGPVMCGAAQFQDRGIGVHDRPPRLTVGTYSNSRLEIKLSELSDRAIGAISSNRKLHWTSP